MWRISYESGENERKHENINNVAYQYQYLRSNEISGEMAMA
jgi:hypothetical protein